MSETRSHDHGRFERAVRELRRPVRTDDLAISRVMHAVRSDRSMRWRRRSVLVAAVAAVVILSVGLWRGATMDEPSIASIPDDNESFVQFVYVGAEAREVSLVGSFNDWDPSANPLRRDGRDGVWSAEVPLPPGHHEYAFNVDGRWVPDDDAPLGASDEFGVANSVILVQ